MNIHEVSPQTVIVDRGRHWVIRIYSVLYEGERVVFVKVNRFSEINERTNTAELFEDSTVRNVLTNNVTVIDDLGQLEQLFTKAINE